MNIKTSFFTDDICFLFQIFNNRLRLVGGCVRDVLLRRTLHDFDFATPLTPVEIVELLKKNQVLFFDTGIKHGTVTAVINHKQYEITSLRTDIKTNGRHAEVRFNASYAEDAARRDFTLNAIYMDLNGRLFDYVGGLKDIQARTIRFIGNPENRIKEDYLRILRYFRFLSVLNKLKPDAKSTEACFMLKEGLKQIAVERVKEEFFKILSGKNAPAVLSLMKQGGVLNMLLGQTDTERFKRFVFLFPKSPVWERLIILCPHCTDLNWKWSKSQKKKLTSCQTSYTISRTTCGAKRLIWQIGRAAFLFHLKKERLLGAMPIDRYYAFQKIKKPVFPLLGRDFYRLGYRGKQIGRLIEKSRQIWIKMNFPSKKSLVIKNVLFYNKKHSTVCGREK